MSLFNRVKDLCKSLAECKEIAEMLKSEKDAKLSGQLIEEMTSLAQSARTLETECLFSDPLSSEFRVRDLDIIKFDNPPLIFLQPFGIPLHILVVEHAGGNIVRPDSQYSFSQ